MPYTFEEFCADCNKALKADSGEAGRKAVQAHFNRILAHPDFIEGPLGENPPQGRHIIHHDKETDMYVMAHVFYEAGDSVPHDHGPFWVIYGNATGYTDMKEFRRIDDGSKEGHAELEVSRAYRIEAGTSTIFPPGAVHAIDYPANSTFIRLTGGDVESGKNLRFDLENKTVEVQDRSKEKRVTSSVVK